MRIKPLLLLQLLLIYSCTFSFAQWSSSPLPNFTSLDYTTHAIVSSSNRLLVATSNGIYKSDNDGASWESLHNGITNPNINCLISSNGLVLAGAMSGTIFISQDNGNSFQSNTTGITPWSNVMAFAQSGSIFYAITSTNEVYASSDQGSSWQLKNNNLPSFTFNGIYAKGSYVYIFGSTGKIYVTFDHGDTWQPASNGIPNVEVNSIASDGTSLWAGVNGGVYKSIDEGATWLSSWTNSPSQISEIIYLPSGSLLASATNGTLYRSIDGGASWNTNGNPFVYSYITQHAIHNNHLFVSAQYHGVYSSDNNGLTWTQQTNGIEVSISKLFNLFGNLYAAGNEFNYVSADEAQSWTVVQGLPSYASILSSYKKDNRTYIGTNGGLFYSDDLGQSWIKVTATNLPTSNLAVNGITGYAANLFLATNWGVFVSADGGIQWQLSNDGFFSQNITAIAYENATVFAVNGSSVYTSFDNGDNWLRNNSLSSLTTNGIIIDQNKIYAFGKGIRVSEDGGATFTALNSPAISNIVDFKIHNGVWYAGGNSNHIYISNDQGLTWTDFSEGLLSGVSFFNRSIEFSTNHVVVAFGGPFDVFRRSLPNVISCPPISEIAGPPSVCSGSTGVNYSVAHHTGVSYNWSSSPSSLVISDNGSSSVYVDFADTDATISVVQSKAGCPDESVEFPVVVLSAIPALDIVGTSEVYANDAGISYSVQSVFNATYTWTVPADASITSGEGTNTILVNFGSLPGDVSVTVTSIHGCGEVTDVFPVTVLLVARPTASIKPATACGGFMGEFYNLSGVFPLKVILSDNNNSLYEFTLNSATDNLRMFPANKTFTLLEVYDANGLVSIASGVSGSITTSAANLVTYPASSFTVSCGGSIQVASVVIVGGTYEWFKLTADGHYTSIGNNDPYLQVMSSGNYTVTYLQPDGCYRQSNPVNVTVNGAPPVDAAISTAGTIDVPCNQTLNMVLSTTAGYPFYKWYKNGNLISGIATNTYTVTTPGTYSVTASYDNVCYTITDHTNTVTIHHADKPPKPTLSGGGGIFIYCGKTSSLNVTNGYLYVFNKFKWYRDGVLISGANLASLTITEAGLYTVEATMDGTCYSDLSASVAASLQNNTDLVIHSSTGVFTISCGASIDLLTAPGYTTYNWYRNDVLIPNEHSNQLSGVSQAGIYEVETVGATCTSTRASRTVVVGSAQALLITPSTVSMTCGNTATLSTIPGYSNYKWFKNNVEILNSNASSLLVSESGQYTVIASNDGICYSIPGVPAQVSIRLTGVFAWITCAKSTISCGEKAILQGGPAQYNYYKWFKDGQEYLVTNVSTLETTSPGSYTVAVSNDNSCYTEMDNSPIAVTLSPLPSALEINNGVNTFSYSYNSGNNTLEKTGTQSGNFENYQWQYAPDANLVWSDISGAVTSSYDFTNVAGAYRLKGSFAGCPASFSNIVTPFLTDLGLITSPLQANAIMCGAQAKITASAGHNNYSWNNLSTNTIVVTTTPEIILSNHGLGSGLYRVTVSGIDDAGVAYRSTSSNIIVQVHSDITPILNVPVLACDGANGSITITNPTGVYASYQWKNSANELIGSANQLLVTSVGTYTLNVTDFAGCSASVAAEVTGGGAAPDFTPVLITHNGNLNFCSGSSTLLMISNLASLPAGSYSYRWYKDGVLIPSSTGQTLAVTSAGKYSLQISAQPGTNKCIGYSNELTISPYPSIDVTVTGPPQNNFCIGMGQTLTAASGSGYSYQWAKMSTTFPLVLTNIAGATQQQYAPVTGGVYIVRVTDANNCTANSGQNVVNMVQGPSTPVIYRFNPPVSYSLAPATITTCSQIILSGTNSSGSLIGNVQWNKDGQPIGGAISSTLTVSESGIYTLTLSQNNCSSTSTAVQVILGTPDATITFENTPAPASDVITIPSCSATPAIFKAASAPAGQTYTYNWFRLDSPLQSVNGLIPVASTQSYTPTMVNKYYVVRVDNGSCLKLSKAYTIINVTSPSSAPAVLSVERCREGVVTLTSTSTLPSGWIYRWTDAQTNVLVQEGTASTYTTPLLSENKTYKISFVNGVCPSTLNSTATASIQTPVLPLVSDTYICGKGKITLSVNPVSNHNYNWYTSVLETPVVATGPTYTTMTLAASRRFYVESFILVNGQECRSPKASIAVTVKAPAVVKVTPVSSEVCKGTNVTLTATGADSYKWRLAGSEIGNASTITVKPTATSTYEVEGSISNGCSSVVTSTITVNPLPVVSLSSDAGFDICEGVEANLTASGANKYEWYTAGNAILIGDKASVKVSPVSTTNYFVRAFDNKGCTSVKVFQVNVQALPQSPVVATQTVCAGSPAVLAVSNPGISVSYNWYTNTRVFVSSGTTLTVPSVTEPQTYLVEAKNMFGVQCTSQLTTASVLVANPIPVQNSTTSLCAGNQVLFSVSTPSPGMLYRWYDASTGGTLVGTGINISKPVAANTSVTYYVESTVTVNGLTCSAPRAAITVNGLPSPNLTTNYFDMNVCEGSHLTLTANGANTYLWSTGEATPSIDVVIPSSVSYSVTGYSTNGCSTTKTINFGVIPTAPAPVVTAENETVCGLESTIFTASGALPGEKYYWYRWGPGVVSSTAPKKMSSSDTDNTWSIHLNSNEYLRVYIIRNGCLGHETIKRITVNRSTSLRFDGVDDKATVTGVVVETSSFSIGAHIKLDQQQNHVSPVLFSKRTDNNEGYVLSTINNGTRIHLWINGENYYSNTIASLHDGLCHSIVAAVDMQGFFNPTRIVNFYLDGNHVGAMYNTNADRNSSGSYALIGNDYSGRPIKGEIHQLTIWDRNIAGSYVLGYHQIGSATRPLQGGGSATILHTHNWTFSAAGVSDSYMNGNGVLGSTSALESTDPKFICESYCYSNDRTALILDDSQMETTDVQDSQSLIAQPNPFDFNTTIKLNGFSSEEVNLVLIDMQGVQLWKKDKHPITESILLGEELNNGMYILQVTSGNEVKTIKIIKAK